MSWYLRSIADQDTHRGHLGTVGLVIADCGAQFPPLPLPFDRVTLPGHPYNPDQICPQCQQATSTR